MYFLGAKHTNDFVSKLNGKVSYKIMDPNLTHSTADITMHFTKDHKKNESLVFAEQKGLKTCNMQKLLCLLKLLNNDWCFQMFSTQIVF